MSKKDDWLNNEFSHLEKKGEKAFVTKLKSNKDKSVMAVQLFFENLGKEAKETQVASKIMVKYMRDGSISKDEEKELKSQLADIFKAVGLGIPFVLIPGASLLLPLLVKIAQKRGIQLLPTAFNENKLKDKVQAAADAKRLNESEEKE
ncbi:MAG: hypothetical protein ACI9J3_000540 [Parvicellaceae bacterium]|jgi:hypothetical protein